MSLLKYKTQAKDTSLEIDLLLVQRWRELRPERKVELITGLNEGCRQLSLTGIHQQFPQELFALLGFRTRTIQLIGSITHRGGLLYLTFPILPQPDFLRLIFSLGQGLKCC